MKALCVIYIWGCRISVATFFLAAGALLIWVLLENIGEFSRDDIAEVLIGLGIVVAFMTMVAVAELLYCSAKRRLRK